MPAHPPTPNETATEAQRSPPEGAQIVHIHARQQRINLQTSTQSAIIGSQQQCICPANAPIHYR
ncbi:MAG: 3-keto-5-aminohexanoate cleavage protein [Candidatus Promineofilum sp.]|nr:3-keto-5-aminohexanoate cleavage protein [Promineifilum sp.]